MKVNVLTDNNFVSYYFFYPVLVNIHALKNNLGMVFRFYSYHDDVQKINDADVVLVDSKVAGWIHPRERLYEYLQNLNLSTNKVIWLDNTASTGTTHFEVLPYVDQYWKKQLLNDISLYEKKYHGERIFTDYYYNIKKTNQPGKFNIPLDPIFKSKIKLSWNLGMGDYGRLQKYSNLIRMLPWSLKTKISLKYPKCNDDSLNKKSIDVSFRGSQKYTSDLIAYQRLEIINRLTKRGVQFSPLKYSQYLEELRRSYVAPSPFGYGEICYRDFEIFISKALLLKPSVEHISTYPNFYKPMKTYFPLSWDLNDFDSSLEYLLSNKDLIRDISEDGFKDFCSIRSKIGMENFMLHLSFLLA